MKKKSVIITLKLSLFFLISVFFIFMIPGHATVFAENGHGLPYALISTDSIVLSDASGTSSETGSTSSDQQAKTSSVEDEVKKIIESYKFDESTSLTLVQPALCYITTFYSAYVYDPVTSQWSAKFTYGPFNGTGFVVNPETGNIITSGDLVDDRETDEVALKNAILDAYIFETYPEDYLELSDTDWTTIYNGFGLRGENTDLPDMDVWVQFNTARVSIPDSPDTNYLRAEVVSVSDSTQGNIAVLKITPTIGRALSSTIIGDSSKITIADSITIMGYPWTADYGQDDILSPSVVKGSISSKRIINGKSVYQATVYAVEGNSGSPVFDQDGTVVGMLTTGTDNMINFLRPSNEIKLVFEGENKLGDVDKEWRAGLALYMQDHYSEAIKYFNAVLNLSSGHLLAQEYKAKAQANMANDVPITAEAAPVIVAETTAQAVTQTSEPQESGLLSSIMSEGLFGLSPLYTYLIFGGALLGLILLIVLIAVLFRRNKPKKKGPDVILSEGPIYIASVNPPLTLSQQDAGENNIKMIETSGTQQEDGQKTQEQEDKELKNTADFDEAGGLVKDNSESGTSADESTNSLESSETAGETVLKKGKKAKKADSKSKKETDEKKIKEKKEVPPKKIFCVNCGSPVLDTSIFCASCGNKLK